MPNTLSPHYPAHRYSPTAEKIRVVNSPEEDEALGGGWYKTPADFPADPIGDEPEGTYEEADLPAGITPKRRGGPAGTKNKATERAE